MVIDSIDVPRGVEKGLFDPLPEDQLPFADLFAEVKMDGSTKVDGKRYGITEKFGYNTIGFNKEKVDPADMQSMAALTDAKYKGRIAIYDYYLPVIGMAALAIGKKTADLTEADLPAIKDVLVKMKANAKLVGEVTASQTALATGEVDILVGGGEWVTAGLAKENPALDFSIPKEGAVLWSQSLAMFKDSKNPDLALKFIQYVLSPEGQARLATSACYWGMPANAKAALNEEQKAILRFAEQPEFLKRAQPYPAPSEDLDKKMQDVWTEMIQAQ
jgi:spermidine/putrescine transport system substrate-binding protein